MTLNVNQNKESFGALVVMLVLYMKRPNVLYVVGETTKRLGGTMTVGIEHWQAQQAVTLPPFGALEVQLSCLH